MMQQRQGYNNQSSQESLSIRPLQQSNQISQHLNVISEPIMKKKSARNGEKSSQVIPHKNTEENNMIENSFQTNSVNTSQDAKPLIMKVKRYKKKLQSVLGNYQQIIYSSPKSELKKDIMFPKLCEEKSKRNHYNQAKISIKVDESISTTPPHKYYNQNQNLMQNCSDLSSSIEQNQFLKGGMGKGEEGHKNYVLQRIINNKNEKLNMQIKQQSKLNNDQVSGQMLKQKPIDSYQQYSSIDNANNSFLSRNARAISQIEHNRRASDYRSYQVEPLYKQSSLQKQQYSQLSPHCELESIDYSQNQTPKAKQVYSSLRHYYPETSKNTKISIDFEEFIPYKKNNAKDSSQNSSSFQLNTLQSSKKSIQLRQSNQFNNQNLAIFNHLSARSARQSKLFGNGSGGVSESVPSSMQTIPFEDSESSQKKLRSIQVNIFQNQGAQAKPQQNNIPLPRGNQNKLMADSFELQNRRGKYQNKVSLDSKYLEDFSLFPETGQQPSISTSRNRQNLSKNSGKRSCAGSSLPPPPNNHQNNQNNNVYKRPMINKISNNNNQNQQNDDHSPEIWNRITLTKDDQNRSLVPEISPKINQSLEFHTFNKNQMHSININNNNNNSININTNTIQQNKTSYDEEIKKITQLQQKNYHDLQNYVNIHLDLINIKTQIRIKSSLAGSNQNNQKNN